MESKPWKSIGEIHEESLKYIEGRRNGSLKSIKLPWSSFNDAGIGGIEWGSITTIAGRPASGKTLIKDMIETSAHSLNPTQDFAILRFQYEMSNKSTGVREFSGVIKRTYKEILSVDSLISEYDLNRIKDYCYKTKDSEIYQIDEPMTVTRMEKSIMEFIEEVKKPVLVTIDHSILIEKGASEKDIFESLYFLGKRLTYMKKRFPVAFIVLTQMNRTIEDADRKKNGIAANYPTTADIFGADALLFHSDIVVVINRPSLYNITEYGPEKFEVTENLLALHFLKTRNGANKLCFFDAMFEHMNIREIADPPSLKRSRRTSLAI